MGRRGCLPMSFRLPFLRLGLGGRHPGVQVEQLLQPLSVVLELAADVDPLDHFVVLFMREAQIIRHHIGIVESKVVQLPLIH